MTALVLAGCAAPALPAVTENTTADAGNGVNGSDLTESVNTTDGSPGSGTAAQASAVSHDNRTAALDRYEGMTAQEITATLTLEEKARQMVIPAIYNVDSAQMRETDYGSILSTYGFVNETPQDWSDLIDAYQHAALEAESPIPFVFGQDSVHGVNYSLDTVIFPHNINIGAVNDEELAYEEGLAVAAQIRSTKMIWNYAPCVAVSGDPRWGRTYESYSSNPEIVEALGTAFLRGQLDGGVIPCAKHYIGDGSTEYGTGDSDAGAKRLLDRGSALLTDEELQEQLEIYRSLVEAGVPSVMISFSSLNGVKMHENRAMIEDVLRGELGFDGVVVSDWEALQHIDGADNYRDQVITCVNAGVDWLMEPARYEECVSALTDGVRDGSITEERIDLAVTRIVQLKMDAGLFEDPYLEEAPVISGGVGSHERVGDPFPVRASENEYTKDSANVRQLARELAAKSAVLLKDEGSLPIREGQTVCVIGPAADDTGVQCGGWTRQWNGMTDAAFGSKLVPDAKTILEALRDAAEEYDLTILTDIDEAQNADLILICIGEEPYAEWNGDTADLSITGKLALRGNLSAIRKAQALREERGIPVTALLVAGRNLIISEEEDNWDSIVMCGLPGSAGEGIADVLLGREKFTGISPMPWYRDLNEVANGR